MGGADALVFSGGIGENSPEVRRRVCDSLERHGVNLDEERNAAMAGGMSGEITADGSRLKPYVIPTNAELLIARETYAVLS